MIQKLIQRVFGRRKAGKGHRAAIIPHPQHGIGRDQIAHSALKVIDKLQEAGYEAFVVGGAVRDLLLGKIPKDFDIATNATPEQVHGLFRRSRIIGRRFKIVHVTFGRDEVIEVTTFRGDSDDGQVIDATGRILHDNVWGSQEQDARRRDFTANALYYNPATQEIIDYHRGVEDIAAKRLVMIGDPSLRYREDPVRMLRAVRLSAKLGLTIDAATSQPIATLAALLKNVPAARLFDEMLKLLFSGHSRQCLQQLRQQGLHHGFFPLLDVIMEQPLGERFVQLALDNTDQRIQADKPVSVGFLFASLLWHEVLASWKDRQATGELPIPALFSAMDEVLAVQEEKLAIPRRYSVTMKEIWALQPRFEQRAGKRPFRLLENPRFRAGYDFLCLRAESGEVEMELAEWWTRFQDVDGAERERMLIKDEAQPAKKRRRRRRKPNAKGGDGAGDAE
ncbi:poly(A) polymerase [Chitinivorax tropicus]|uniref:Poly(A) polymerase I n=1 Tax=Chitinivorax tropicus TaxID=714531 RepID=A0A840MKU3_9PROT|nr:polynucleotide adenylyltransferase PcnB [Chitinivorax tropicus]MBB5018125.1 poly(A) polymerase [Chitinivorax tropicus]